ncbi:MAG: iron-containing alcohol dehydrogenase [Christensenellales bacterium]|jgi:alcohol dehydrogenase class IV
MSVKSFSYNMPVRVEFGEGAASNVANELLAMGCKKPLIVTDKGVVGAGLLAPITQALEEAKVPVIIFDEVVGNPTDVIVENGIKMYSDENCDSLIAVGGGSSMDSAKAIGLVKLNGGNIREYDEDNGHTRRGPNGIPTLITIPTTAGTGSEVTPFAVITDTSRHWKMSITPGFAKVALIDPLMTVSMPGSLVAATGMDALTHAVEAYITKNTNIMSDFINLYAIELIARYLRRSFANGADVEARAMVLLGNSIAGIGFQQVGLGSVHALAHILGGQLNVPHGVGNAMLLPYVMEFNMPAKAEKLADIAIAMGENVEGMSVIDAAEKAVAAVKRLSADIGIPRLRDVGCKEEDFPKYAELALKDGNTNNNPRETSVKDYINIYKKAY